MVRQHRKVDIFSHRGIGEDIVDLECATDPAAAKSMGRMIGDVCAFEEDAARLKSQAAAKEIEQRRFAGTVGTDDGLQFTSSHGETDGVNGFAAIERAGDIFNLKHRLRHYGALSQT